MLQRAAMANEFADPYLDRWSMGLFLGRPSPKFCFMAGLLKCMCFERCERVIASQLPRRSNGDRSPPGQCWFSRAGYVVR